MKLFATIFSLFFFSNLGTAQVSDAIDYLRNCERLCSNACRNSARDLAEAIKDYENECSQNVGEPKANLTVNDRREVEVDVGDTITYEWTSENGQSFHSYFSRSGNPTCAAQNETWIANNAAGIRSYRASEASRGCTAIITYEVTNANGRTARSIIKMKIRP